MIEEEQVGCIVLHEKDITEGIKEDELSILAHIHGGNSINFKGFKATMSIFWRCYSFSIQQRNENF